MDRNRVFASILMLSGLLVGSAATQGVAAAASTTLFVSTDASPSTVHPGDATVVAVTVQTTDTATSGRVVVRLTPHRGVVTAVDSLGFPLDCTTQQGVGLCVSEAPLGVGHSFELAATIKSATDHPNRTTVTTLTALARSPADNASAADTASVLVVPR
jgi:hypothetical protein